MNSHVRPYRGGIAADSWRVHAALEVDVTVVMVVYRTGPVLAQSVARVLDDKLVGELVLVDNGSTAEEAEVLDIAAREPRVTLIRGQGNVGFARGANMGAGAAHGRCLVILNPDALLEPDCIAALKDALTAQGSPCLVGARVLNPDRSEQRGGRRGEVTPVTTLLSLTRLSRRLRAFRGFEIHHEDDGLPGEPVPVPTISGACLAMMRYDFAAMGGFDTGYFLHVEDVDMCWRVRQSGGVVLFQPRAQVVHLGSTSHSHPIKVEFHKGVGLARYLPKRPDNPARRMLAAALSLPIIAVSVARPVLRKAVRGRALARTGRG